MGSPVYRDSAVVLRTYKLAEADRIVVLMTEHHGKVRAVAKGVRKTMSKFGARLEPLSHVQLLLAHGRTDLDIVSQAESVETLAPLVCDLDHLTNGMAMLEAVDQMALEREPAPHLYHMLVGALRTVARRSGPLVVPAFYWKLLAAEGITPLLDECARCGEPGPLVALDMDHGGALCRNCRSGAPLGAEALELMRMVLGGRLNEALSAPPSAATHEVAAHATRAMEHHIERRLRTVAMFERMET
ncbi:MAG: repair protein RecO [Ilumatobacteraceae bacterium]|jgi:DNA repair protein RecO (recombination protein O)|nr:repair protein RecO [Ilumatobacteraceae bacterium]